MIVISILAKVTLMLGAGAAIQIALARRMSAATRHLVWMLAIAGVLLLPALAISLPDWTPVEYTEPAGVVPIFGAGSLEPPVLDAPAAASISGTPRIQWSWILAAIYVAGVAKTHKDGVERARRVIASGDARRKLDDFVAFSKKLKA